MIQNANVREIEPIAVPEEVKGRLPLPSKTEAHVNRGQEHIRRILSGEDRKLLLVVGPCSVHDPEAALEYARRLKELAGDVSDVLLPVMRVYFEKPRTVTGWKGLIYDPDMDGSLNIEKGLVIARELLLKINNLGVLAGTEFLDPIVPQYIDDLVSWAAVGARTVESQTHRQMASGLSMPVGFKNTTSGDVKIATHAMKAARSPQRFLGINESGRVSTVSTKGNRWGHVILRGGTAGTNFSSGDIDRAERSLREAELPERLMVDCSHANSAKQCSNQAAAFRSVLDQFADRRSLVGAMLESNLSEGQQPFAPSREFDRRGLDPQLSVTDACIGWDETCELIRAAHGVLCRA